MYKFIIFLLFPVICFSQESRIFKYEEIEVPPVHLDCENAEDYSCSLNKIGSFLQKNFNKEIFEENELMINFKLKFIMDNSGEVKWAKAITKNTKAGKEAEALIKTLPQFIPGTLNDEEVSVMYTMPVSIRNFKKFPGTFEISEVDTPPVSSACKTKEDQAECLASTIARRINLKTKTHSLDFGFYEAIINLEINKQGEISNYQVISNSKDLSEVLYKVKKHLPEVFLPASLNGENVGVSMHIPVSLSVSSPQ
ncbi:hypothetical protein [Christiangramia aquimixticola]|uniref:hypothetical protein n=1 Tax=Christiangramia aquimixticola TaxID=1697558 RepID=UPI003AA8E7B7